MQFGKGRRYFGYGSCHLVFGTGGARLGDIVKVGGHGVFVWLVTREDQGLFGSE
jgi:hypothetical protein